VALAQRGAHPPEDPWESFNRKSFAFSMKVDRAVIAPISRLSASLTPGPIRSGIHNIVVNLSEPVVLANDLIQVRFRRALKSAARLVVNSTVGLLGILDVAGHIGIPHHPNGFGDTLGRYGVRPGPYLYVPILGPGTVRDLFGSAVDDVSNPIGYLHFPYRTDANLGLHLVEALDERARAEPELQALLSGAADPYATLRSTYLQMREAEVRGQAELPALPDIPSAPATIDPAAAQSPGPEPAPAQQPRSDASGAAESDAIAPLAPEAPPPASAAAPPSPPPSPATPPAEVLPPEGRAPA
jgi:phospholipid-binding lipoprotein MlaA